MNTLGKFITLFPSTLVNDGGVQVIDPREKLSLYKRMIFLLNVSAVEGSPTFNVYLQTSVDGTNWTDVISFAQATGTGRQYAFFVPSSQAGLVVAEQDGSLTAGTANTSRFFSDNVRIKWTLSGTNVSVTFSIRAWVSKE